ncbi:MAG: FkbM family methyltransferase, partial [Verrucomicrobiota bacterium]
MKHSWKYYAGSQARHIFLKASLIGIPLPRNIDHKVDLRRYSEQCIDIILDAGANRGNTVLSYRSYFKPQVIYAFEPVVNSFNELKLNCQGFPDVRLFQMGLGDCCEKREINLSTNPEGHSLVRQENPEGKMESVRLTTVDHFVGQEQINRIDLLKMDVEGFEMQLLHGARESFESGKI